MNAKPDWVDEPTAAQQLMLSAGTLRNMRTQGRLEPGKHFVFATGVACGPVHYDITAIRAMQRECAITAVQERAARRAETAAKRRATIESYAGAQA